MDNIDPRTRDKANTKWKFYKLTNQTVFAALLRHIPMRCKDTVLLEPILRNCNVNCLFLREMREKPTMTLSVCMLALHLHVNEKLEEETSIFFNLFLNNSEEGDVSKIQGVHFNDILKVEDL